MNGPRLATRRVYLDYPRPSDFELIYELFVNSDTGPSFRFGGRVPSAQHVHEHLWDGVLAQWMVTGIRDGGRKGLVILASPDFANGFAYASALATSQARRTGLVLEGMGLVIDYAFRTWPLRKLYAEVSEPTLRQFARTVGRFCVEEGRLKQHHFRDGEFRDLVILAIYRENWRHLRASFGKLESRYNPATRERQGAGVSRHDRHNGPPHERNAGKAGFKIGKEG
jgi:RimJ/RimL family protein N-acetyltransferase